MKSFSKYMIPIALLFAGAVHAQQDEFRQPIWSFHVDGVRDGVPEHYRLVSVRTDGSQSNLYVVTVRFTYGSQTRTSTALLQRTGDTWDYRSTVQVPLPAADKEIVIVDITAVGAFVNGEVIERRY